MKTEKFDEAIKRKVESIDHRFEEKDIVKVLHFINTHRGPGIFRGPFRQFILFSFSAIVITTILTWQLTKWHDHKILNETIAQLKNNNSSYQSINKTYLSGIKNNEAPPIQDDNSVVLNGNALNENIHNPGKENSLQRYHQPGKININDIQKSIHPGQKLNETRKQNYNYEHGNNPGTDKGIIKQNTIPGINNDKIIDDKLAMNNISSQEISPLQRKGQPDSISSELKEKESLTENKKPESPSPKDVKTYRGPKYNNKSESHADLHILAGGTFSIGDNSQLGAGLTSELILNRRFGFSAGIKVLGISTSSPYTESDYNEICGEDFRDRYEHNKDRNFTTVDSITNQTNIIQIPLSLSYYFPLKNNFAVSVSLGTDLDVYKYQEISFRETTVKPAPPPYHPLIQVSHQERNNDGNGIMFNNAVISAGILKQWGHYVVQLSPYFSYQLINTDYKLENYYIGGNIKLLYSFGKGGF